MANRRNQGAAPVSHLVTHGLSSKVQQKAKKSTRQETP